MVIKYRVEANHASRPNEWVIHGGKEYDELSEALTVYDKLCRMFFMSYTWRVVKVETYAISHVMMHEYHE